MTKKLVDLIEQREAALVNPRRHGRLSVMAGIPNAGEALNSYNAAGDPLPILDGFVFGKDLWGIGVYSDEVPPLAAKYGLS